MISYRLQALTPAASTYSLKLGEYAPASTAYKYAGWIPATTLYGLYCWRNRGECLEGFAAFYPALPAARLGEGLYGLADCGKEECTYVDFCTLAAFRGPKTSIHTGRLVKMAGIYVDRSTKTAKHGVLYYYELYPSDVEFVTAASVTLPEAGSVGYKKSYGWGRVEIKPYCHAAEAKSSKLLFLSPMPRSALEALGKVEGARLKLGRWLIYLARTNRYYFVGRSFDETYLMPLTEVKLGEEARPSAVMRKLSGHIRGLKVYTSDGREVRDEEVKEEVLKKAAATSGSPVAMI